MKILLAESMSYFGLGGACKANRGLMEGLAQRGHSCAVVSVEDGPVPTERGFKPGGAHGGAVTEINGVKVFAAPSAQEQSTLFAECLRAFDPDWTLICEHGVLLLVTALEEFDPARIVLLAQSIITDLPTEPDAVLEDGIRSLLGKVAGIITISDYMRDYIRRWCGRDSTIIHFPSYGSGLFTRFSNFDSGYVTMINPCVYKGISIFLALARALPQVRFAAVPFWGTSAEDHAALAQLPNVTTLRPSPDVDDIFERTKVLLVPSLWGEAYGQVVIDAMLRGVPVLASNVGGLPEAKLGVDYVLPVNMIERYESDGEARVLPVVPEQDVRPWVDALSGVLTDRALYERISSASREAALSFVGGLGPIPFERYFERLAASRARDESDAV